MVDALVSKSSFESAGSSPAIRSMISLSNSINDLNTINYDFIQKFCVGLIFGESAFPCHEENTKMCSFEIG